MMTQQLDRENTAVKIRVSNSCCDRPVCSAPPLTLYLSEAMLSVLPGLVSQVITREPSSVYVPRHPTLKDTASIERQMNQERGGEREHSQKTHQTEKVQS